MTYWFSYVMRLEGSGLLEVWSVMLLFVSYLTFTL